MSSIALPTSFLERYTIPKLTIRRINILACGLVVSLLLGDFALSSFIPLPSVRVLQFIIVFNLLAFGFKFINRIWIYFLVTFIFIIHSIFFINIVYISSDLINIAWWTTFCFILNFYLRDLNDYELFKKTVIYLSFLWCSSATLLGLYKFKLIVSGVIEPWMEFQDSISGKMKILSGTSLSGDYNVYSIGLYCGFFAGLYIYRKLDAIYLKIPIAIMMLLMILAATLSTSRRALILAPIIILVFLFSKGNIAEIKAKFYKFAIKRPKLSPKFWPWKTITLVSVGLLVVSQVNIKSLYNKSLFLQAYMKRMASVEKIGSKKEDTRTIRWEYSWEYYKGLPLQNQIFGDGFKYVELIGKKFKEAPIDHPHNIFISALLYGGIFGFLTTVFFVFYLFYLYFDYRDIAEIFSIWFLLLMFLSFSSSNSIYSSRLGVFLLIFPLLNFWKYRKLMPTCKTVPQHQLT